MTVEELEVIVKANTADFNAKIKSMQSQLTATKNTAASATSAMKSSFTMLAKTAAITMTVKLLKDSNDAYQTQMQNELKLETVMRQRMGATTEDIQQIKELTAAQQQLGVVGDEVQLAGAQQIATFATQKSTLETLIPAMNNLLVQQNGLNATADDAVSIGNLMGKVLQGQTSALTRVGITFTEAQEQMLKYGTEEQRAATLAQVITDNVGEMNEAFRNTTAGQAKALMNDLGDTMEKIGAAIQPVIASALPIFNQLLNAATPVISMLSSGLSGLAEIISAVNDQLSTANPTQQTALKLALGLAVAIPAVTLATKAMTAAKAAYTAVVNVLIPKQLTFAAALKATLGWMSLIIGALALFGIMNNDAGEATDSVTDDMKSESDAAKKMAEGLGEVSDATDGLADSAKRALAGFDELNRLGSSDTVGSGIISGEDLDNVYDYGDALSDVMTMVDNTDMTGGLSGFMDLFGQIIDKVKQGDLKGAWDILWNAIDKTMSDALGEDWTNFKGFWGDVKGKIDKGDWLGAFGLVCSGIDGLLRETLGEDYIKFSDFWSGVGQKMGEGDWEGAFGLVIDGLTDLAAGFFDWFGPTFIDQFKGIDEWLRNNEIFGGLWAQWSDFWQSYGASYYQMTHDDAKVADLSSKYGDMQYQMTEYVKKQIRDGETAEDAITKAKAEFLTSNEASWYYENAGIDNVLKTEAPKWEKANNETGYLNNVDLDFWSSSYNQDSQNSTLKQNTLADALAKKKKITAYASGGFPDYGSLFIANEAGPELVGTLGGRTAVVNNSQIEDALYNAVARGISDGMMSGGNNNGGDIRVYVELDSEVVAEAVARQNEIRNRRFNGRG